MALYHDRQMAVLRREQRLDWLDSQAAEDKLLRPLPAGSFRVKEVQPTLGFEAPVRFDRSGSTP